MRVNTRENILSKVLCTHDTAGKRGMSQGLGRLKRLNEEDNYRPLSFYFGDVAPRPLLGRFARRKRAERACREACLTDVVAVRVVRLEELLPRHPELRDVVPDHDVRGLAHEVPRYMVLVDLGRVCGSSRRRRCMSQQSVPHTRTCQGHRKRSHNAQINNVSVLFVRIPCIEHARHLLDDKARRRVHTCM